jgi:predicted transcriptional regulator
MDFPDSNRLTRRERQIMDVLYVRGEATVNNIAEALPDPPTPMAVRRMMHILEEKGHVRRREQGREVVYLPRESKAKAGRSAFERVLETFFGGSLEEALAAHLLSRKEGVSAGERDRLVKLIERARIEGR